MSTGYERRRTFAIISHPDAGKTTLTEKLLLSGGAIHMAGAVKARGEARRARSDWMKIEQDRGISVTSSVMTFDYRGLHFNLLDTPGHEDFSEDTYRTLTAVDSAIMVIDAAKGIESQTRKLFEVCRLRDIPITTFVNKVDREGRDPFEVLDEVHEDLQLDIAPIVWPVGLGGQFHGLVDLRNWSFMTSSKERGAAFDTVIETNGLDSGALDDLVEASVLEATQEAAELAAGGYEPFNETAYREGNLTPVIFGSALRGYGIGPLLDLIADHAPPPRPNPAEPRTVEPNDPDVSGFVFKVQANMDKNHRDRVAFMRLCSGTFKRGMKLKQVRTAKDVLVHSPIVFMAQDRAVTEEAGPGDVIGIPNHGTIRVGDTFTEGEELRFTGLPVFAPEILRRVRMTDSSKTKQLRQALTDLSEEGLIQVFKPSLGAQYIVGAVGQLQLDVLASRAAAEYRVEIAFEPVPYSTARWLKSEDEDVLDKFVKTNSANIVYDRDESPVYMAGSAWDLNYRMENNQAIAFEKTRDLN
ncbi:MAG: peptide chain release factor 3 [Pseudomonadota bacterium]